MKEVTYESNVWLVVSSDGNIFHLSDGRGAEVKCHISSLGPQEGITFHEIKAVSNSVRRIEGRVKRFFRDLITRTDLPKKRMAIKVMMNEMLSSQLVCDLLNHYGVYGCAGVVNIHYEWRFRRMESSDEDALQFAFSSPCDEVGNEGMRGKKYNCFVGEVKYLLIK